MLNIFENMKRKSDKISFADETSEKLSSDSLTPWKVIISDDDQEIHSVTRMVFDDFTFDKKPIEFISAFSGEETQQVIRENPDTAVILLDVVMEQEDAGLETVRYIREVLKNKFVRIILRTGQPGVAPEHKVITEYDINDYKEKTELTSQKLITTVVNALRTYRDINTLEFNRKALKSILDTSVNIFMLQSHEKFLKEILNQLVSLLNHKSADNIDPSGFVAVKTNGHFSIYSVTEFFQSAIGKDIDDLVSDDTLQLLNSASNEKNSIFERDFFISHIQANNNYEYIIYFTDIPDLNDLEKNIIHICISNARIALNNILLNEEIVDTQKELIFTLGEVVESRSKETANHVRRVGEMSYLLAKKAGVGEDDAEILRCASPMHDVGKIGIPESIIEKPGSLNEEEFECVKLHTIIGKDILKASDRPIMKAASVISLEHHERWDGKGYPHGLKGTEINIFARITAITDVFDALNHKRVYKEAWSIEQIHNHFIRERGKQFDPVLMDLFFENFEEFLNIQNKYRDDSIKLENKIPAISIN